MNEEADEKPYEPEIETRHPLTRDGKHVARAITETNRAGSHFTHVWDEDFEEELFNVYSRPSDHDLSVLLSVYWRGREQGQKDGLFDAQAAMRKALGL